MQSEQHNGIPQLASPHIHALTVTASVSGVAFFFISLFVIPLAFTSDYGWFAAAMGFVAWAVVTLVTFLMTYTKSYNGCLDALTGRAPVKEAPILKKNAAVYSVLSDPGIVRIANQTGQLAVLPKGIDIGHLVSLRNAIDSGEIDAISARSIHEAHILSRDPLVSPNAADLVEWITRKSYGLTEPIGNNRHKLTRAGKHTLLSLPDTPSPFVKEELAR